MQKPWKQNKMPNSLVNYFNQENPKSIIIDEIRLQNILNEAHISLESRCWSLRGQNLQNNEEAPKYSPTNSRLNPNKNVGCKIGISGLQYPLPALIEDIDIPLCSIYPKDSNDGFGLISVVNNKLWDASFLLTCEKLIVDWYTPRGWITENANKDSNSRPLVTIPAGSFTMGGCKEDIIETNSTTKPLWSWDCDSNYDSLEETFQARTEGFNISKYPITVSEFAKCVLDGKCNYSTPEPDVQTYRKSECNWGKQGRSMHPMNCISWDEAAKYCSENGGSLPTEKQWEKAARGVDGRKWAWGSTDELGLSKLPDYLNGTAQVGLAPELGSPYGVEDIGWHIQEWTQDNYIPYTSEWSREQLFGENYNQFKVQKGISSRTYTRRARPHTDSEREMVGFRCVF